MLVSLKKRYLRTVRDCVIIYGRYTYNKNVLVVLYFVKLNEINMHIKQADSKNYTFKFFVYLVIREWLNQFLLNSHMYYTLVV